ncbi:MULTISPECIES: DUF4189 domain-containing protein [unclassified Mycobacterium]|uniref:DUF4189 domain-containing protein n=1 Tax=unclassified Mycobacterium TaxID=2642494 RepID=UPI0029C8E43E|nr:MULTISPECIES: DUF4189 domain-containing protein [unclassified Mycobacterium]
MTTTIATTSRRRTLVAATLTAAALSGLAAGGLSTAAPATAASGEYVAVTYSTVYKVYGYGRNANKDVAVTAAMHNCNIAGGFCGVAAVSPKNGCVVLSTRNGGAEYVGGSGTTLPKAMKDAQSKLYGSQVKNYYCI